MRLIKPIFHPYWKWEEIHFNMWGTVDDREAYIKKTVEFTGSHCLYGIFMNMVIHSWPMSCEHNLSQVAQNRRAWLGHAACAFAFNCPEDIVRQAWWMLTDEQRKKADAQAEKAIRLWEDMVCQKDQLAFLF